MVVTNRAKEGSALFTQLVAVLSVRGRRVLGNVDALAPRPIAAIVGTVSPRWF